MATVEDLTLRILITSVGIASIPKLFQRVPQPFALWCRQCYVLRGRNFEQSIYETTSSSLAYAFHFLAKYTDLQQKIHEEIDSLIEKEGHLDYYKMGNFQLTERFILETMRFYSPTMNFVSRICTANIDYGHVKIPKGMEILVPEHYIHYSEEFWEQPEEFNIDRYLTGSTSKKHPISYLAFGHGPRRCIGVRLVNITTKIIIARILQKYTVELVENHDKVNSVLRAFTIVPESVYVKLKPRT
ncbi:cytochrome P450 3A13 [Trichonephila clavipes]|nr:cytochrome P450 3A13 [Trichonephila clavipes]